MILVDNFRIFLLVGLICMTGIGPTLGEVCKKADNTDDTCVIADKPNCLVGTDGEAGGCAANADCPGGNAAADAPSCADSKCCCKAGATACNDPSTIKTTFCSLPGAPTGGKCAGDAAAPPPSDATTPKSGETTTDNNSNSTAVGLFESSYGGGFPLLALVFASFSAYLMKL